MNTTLMEANMMLSKLYMHIFFHPAIPLLEICPTDRLAQMKWCYAQIKTLLIAAFLKTTKD